MKVLIVKTSSIGDLIHTLPALTDAMLAIPNISFDWVVEENLTEIPTWHESVNIVIPVAIRRWRKSWFSYNIRKERKEFRNAISAQKYDAIIDAQGLIKSAALITRISHGLKHGMDWKSSRESLASIFYNYNYFILKEQHAIERIRELFANSLSYSKPKTKCNYAISQIFKRNLLNFKFKLPYFIFLHATTNKKKQWPENNWRKLIKLIQPTGINIRLPWYTEYERQRAEYLATGFSHVKVLPKLSLTQVAKQLANAQAVVSVDTGLSHITAALEIPNITIFGPTNPKLIGNYGKNQYHIVSNTKKMTDITANKIYFFIQKNFFDNYKVI